MGRIYAVLDRSGKKMGEITSGQARKLFKAGEIEYSEARRAVRLIGPSGAGGEAKRIAAICLPVHSVKCQGGLMNGR